MTMTLTEKYLKALHNRGWTIVEGLSSKYTTLAHPAITTKLFVGRSGSIRRGDVYTRSVPVSDTMKANLLAELEASNG